MPILVKQQNNKRWNMEDNTLPKLLKRNYHKYGNARVAMRRKEKGIWKGHTWEDVYLHVKLISLGLLSIGLKPGQAVILVGDNCPEFYWIELAIHCANATSVIVFAESETHELAKITNDTGATFAVVQDQELVRKMEEARKAVPKIRKLIYWETQESILQDDPWLLSLDELEGMGREYEDEHPGLFEQNIDHSKADDICILSYTSNITSSNLGAMVTYDNLLRSMREFVRVETWYADDEYFSFMPIASFWEQNLGVAGSLLAGITVNFPERADTVQRDIHEISPHMLQCPSSVWEELATSIRTRISNSHFLSRTLFKLLISTRIKVSQLKATGQKPGFFSRILWVIAHAVLFKQLLSKLGFIRNRVAYTDGRSMDNEAFYFLRALGINVKHLFGTTETQINTVRRAGDVRNDTVGTAIPGCEVKIGDGKEILLKCVAPFNGYYKRQKVSKDKIAYDGWFRTSERGYMVGEGHLALLGKME